MAHPKSRHWFVPRYSLRTLLFVMTIACLVSGVWFNKAFRQRDAVRRFNQLTMNRSGFWGKTVIYRNADGVSVTRPQISAWLDPFSRVIGEEAFGEVIAVDLVATTATDEDLRHLAAVPAVEQLSLSNTKVTDKGLRYLRSCPKLKFLALNSALITDDGMEQLAALTELERLSLVGTNVTDAGLRHLEKLPKLRVLSLQGTAISDDGYRKLQAALPKCSICAYVPSFREKWLKNQQLAR